MKGSWVAAIPIVVAGSVPAGQPHESTYEAVATPARVPSTPGPASQPQPAEQPRPELFTYDGELTQGGWIRGQAPWRATRAMLGNTALPLDAEGRFFAAFDRDAPGAARE